MPVRYEKKGRAALITLDWPDNTATLDVAMAYGLVRQCQEASEDSDILAVVLTASGRTFCLAEVDGEPPSEDAFVSGLQEPGQAAVQALAGMCVPVIAAINGPAAGIGVELALASDIRFASERATFQFDHLARGVIPHAGGTQRLPHVVGKAYALELTLLGERIDAQEAWRMGLVGKLFPHDRLLAEATSLAERMTRNAPIATRYIREVVNKGMDMTLEQGLRLEGDLYFLLQTTADRMEGIRAFLEKRTPTFRGE